MATVFERWAQTARELKAAKATPEQAEAAREELRKRFAEKMEEAKLDPATRAVALSRFESGTNALSVKHGLKKEADPLTEDERYALEHPVLGGITQAGKEVVAPLAQGVQRIAGGAARLLNDIGDNEKGTVLDRFANNMDDAQKSVDDWAGQGYAEADGVRGFAKSALQNAPQIALSLLPGAALGKAASLATAARGAQAGAKVLKYGMPVAAGLSFGQNYAGEYGDARKQTEDKLAKAAPDDLRASNAYGSDFKSLERKFFDDGMSADDAATAARDALVDSIAERRADAAAIINTGLEFVAPGAMAVMPGFAKTGSKMASDLALAGKMASGGRFGSKAANLSDLKDVGLQFLQEGLQGGVTERAAEGARANAFNDKIDYGSVLKSAALEAAAGGIIGGASQMASGGTSRRRAQDAVKEVQSRREQYISALTGANAELQRLSEIRNQRPLTEEESYELSAATMEAEQARAAVSEIDSMMADAGLPNPAHQPMPQPAPEAGQPQPQPQPQDMTQPAPAQQEPASGLSGVVQRAQASTAPDLTTVVNEAIASGQTPDFSALAQAANRDRSEVVDLFNRRRTLVDLADAGDLNGMRDMAARMTADPQEQQSLIEQAVAVRDKRRVMASQPQPTQQAEPQQPATPIKTPRDTAYEKMLADAESSLASGASDVDTFLAVRKKYAGNKDLVDTDINGVIDDAKTSLSGKREAAAKREAAIESAIPHLKAGDEVSAVTALADAGITDDADIQAVFKEANSRLKAKPAAAQAKPQQSAQPAVIKSPMEQAVEAVSKAQEGGKGVKLATIAKKYGVGLVDLAKQVAAAKTAPVNTKQPEERKASPVLALPAPKDAPVQADQPLVSRRGRLLPKAQADAMAEQSAAEKRDMRRAMSEEAGNPTGVPTGMRPRVETPARSVQKAVLPDVILRTDGEPFQSETEATRAMNRKGAQETHEVAQAPKGNGVVIKRKQANTIDIEKDDILAAIAKAGGVNWDQARKQGGFDPAESGRRGSGILRVFKKNGGMTLDGMAEHLSQFGYPVTDENGDYTVNALLDAMDTALRGGQVGTAQFNERLAREMYEKEAELRALDDSLDSGSSGDMPSWLDDSAESLVESLTDNNEQPSAVMADALNEVENEREITSPSSSAGQETDTGAEARGGERGNAPTAGAREGGQQEGKGGAGQDPGVQAGFQLTAQTEAERLAEEQRQAADLEAKRKEEEKARLKAQADREISSFTLTGSDRPADVAMAAGQKDLFAPRTRGEKEEESKAASQQAKDATTDTAESKPEPVKWFGSRDKAEAWITKVSKVNGGAYHVVQAGPSRFEVFAGKKIDQSGANSASGKSKGYSRKRLGVNYRGETLYEDEMGVRSYATGGVLVSEPVSIIPGRGIERGELTKEYKTTDELAAEKSQFPENTAPAEDLDSMFDDVLAEVTGKPKEESRQELFAELREKLSALGDRAFSAGDGGLSGRMRGFTVGMNPSDPMITRQWVDDVVAEREKIVRKLEKKAGIKAESSSQERTAGQEPVESAFTGEPDSRNSAPMQELGGFAVGDKVSISGRSFSEGVIRKLFTRQSVGGEMRMARVEVAGDKTLDLLIDNLSIQERTAGQAAASAAKNTGMALGEAIDGLGKLFGGKGTLGSGLVFDEETYAKAKPYFVAAISHLKSAGSDLREAMRAVVKMVVDKFGVDAAENMKPYVVQFISDVRDGKIDDPAATLKGSDTNEATGNDVRKLDTTGQGALEGVSSGEVQGAGTGRGTGSGAAEGGRGNGGADGSVAGAGGERDGGVGNRTERVPVSGTGAGGSGRGRSRSSGGNGRAVSAQPAAGNEQVNAGGLTADANQPSEALEPGRIDPPQLPDDFIIEEDFALGEGGQRTKYKNNVEAIRLIRDLEATGRTATTDEQKVLAKYVGWGGIPQAFDPENKDWSAQYAELKSLLSDDEWDAAFESTQYAHYTSREIINGMYAAVRRLGFTGGNVLEAGGGVGNFIGLMPVDLRTNGKVTLVERENIAAAIARHLYPRQNVRAEDFTEFGKGQDGQYDMQIGNPPFSSNPLTDKSGRKHLTGLSVHNYFISKGVDMLREGGIMAVVVSNSFMDAGNVRAREYIAKRAKLLGAIRLPNNAFSKNANTQVTTDIIFLQKLPESAHGSKAAIADGKRWVGVTTVNDPQGKGEVALNQYFADNRNMMLGEWGKFGTMYGPDQPALVARPGQDTGAMLMRAIAALPEGVYTPASESRTKAMEGALLEKLHDKTVDEGGFYVNGGKLWRRVADAAGEEYAAEITPNTVISGTRPIGHSGVDRLRQLAEIRRAMRELLAAETEDRKADMDRLRKELNTRYDSYVADNGRINDPTTKRLMRDDPDYPLIAALEMDYEPGIGPAAAKAAGIKPQTSKSKKAAIFNQRVIEARKAVTKADSPQDAINVSMAERGRLDAEYIGRLLDVPADEVLGQLASGAEPLLFRDPATGEYVLRDAYLSGNVREKLKQAKAAGLTSNVRALEAVQPEDIPASKISVRIGSPWVPVSVYAEFANNLFGEGTKTILRYVKSNGGFSGVIIPSSEVMASTKFGIKDYNGDAILLAIMNNRQIRVMTKDEKGKPVVDAALTEEANSKAEDIKQAFQDWIFKDADRAEVLVRAYNDANNNYVVRKYDGSWLKFPGKVPDAVIRFRRHQRNAIARTIQDRTTLYDHVVGAGKTFTAIASAMEMRRMGLIRKPLMVVPNHLVGQWASDFYRLYPGAKVLAATKKDFERENRRRFLAKIASGDWDAVIIAHSSFGNIRPSPEFEQKFTQAEIDRIMREAKEVEASDGDEQQKKRTVKQLAAMQERLENRIAKLRDKPMDDLLDFQQLGVDQLFVDEAHLFKNLMFTTKMQNVRGLGDPTGSQRAYDMYIKTNQIMEQNGRGQGVAFMTGTPVSNSLAEMYHMMRYLMPDQMRQLGFESFDAWANTYASVNQVWMQTAGGDGFKAQNRMSNFDNVPELLRLFDQVSDTVTMDDIKEAFKEETGKDFPLPKLLTGRRQPVSLDKTPAQEAYMKDIIDRLKKLESRKGPPKKGEDNHLTIMSDARKAAMDIRLVDMSVVEREKGARVDRASDEIFTRWKKYDADRGTQLVFADLGTPISTVKNEAKGYDAIMARITAGEDPDTITMAQLGDEEAAAKVNDAESAREELDAKGKDWLTAIEGAKRGFSVYDDLKKALMEKGIPENQIAFIHSYNTDDQKSALFRKVNSGEIRILMGSTAKMGAGTNVQKRLVALHHLDVPWKPSDLEQREGRIIRQGNELADKNPDFEVEILAYVTKDTLDMRMWQIQEVKLKMINQLRTRSVDRELENAFEDMEMSAGEMQAAATGNMDMLREIQLRTEVQKLEKKQRAFDAGKADAIAGIRRATREIERLPAQIATYERLSKASEDVLLDVFTARNKFKATINGKEYSSHTEAAKVLRDLVDAVEVGEDGKERKAKLDVSLNGEQFTNRQKLAEAFARLTGDNEPFVFDAGDGKVYRVDDAADAVMDTIATSRDSEGEKLLGNMGDYKVSIEYGGEKLNQDEVFEVHASLGDDDLPSAVVRAKPGDDRHAAKEILKAVRNMVRDAGSALSSLKASLEKAKKNLADLSKIDTTSEWPDSDKLARMREEHKALRDKMNKEAEANKEQGKEQGGEMRMSVQSDTSGPGLTTSRAREILSADPVLSKALPFIDIRNSKEGVPEGAEPFGEEGYYHNGRITLFADNIRATGSMSAEERLKWVAFHEITHRGVANLAESQAYLSELERAGKNPYVKNLAKKIYEARQELDEKYHVSMEVATEEALAEINAALRTGNVKQIKEQYGLHFPLSIRPRAKSAAARFIEAVKRIINRMFGRGLTDSQVENLLRRTNDAGMTPDGGPGKGSDTDTRYSPSPKDWITEQGRITKRVLSKEVAQRDLTLWQKTLGTPLNAALKNPAFKKVYDLTQRLIQHVNNDAYDSLNAAPDVLSRLEDWNDYKRDIANTAKEAGAALTMQQSKRRKDMAAAAEVLFEGTRFDKKVYSDKELDAFKLTADQKEIYRQARAAIDKSVGNAGKSQALNVAMNAEAINWATVERLVNMDLDPEVLFSEVSDLIDTRIAATKMEAENSTNEDEIKKLDKQVEKLSAALASIGEIQAIVEKSATEGYAPLMRWGKYTVAVIDPVDGKTLRFHMLESKREQAALELKLREKYGVANVVGGVLDEGRFEQFKGITPETVALFASVTGMDQDAAYQEYLKLAIPGRSALKRKIHRKGDMGEGIEGFSTDLPRVLSSFVLSNARKSARDLYRGPINDAIEDINAGGVAEKARELAEFVLEPDENDWSVGIRNTLFVWNMGASVAFGVLNLSQPWMMTLPWLSQFQDPVSAAGVMVKAAKLAASAQASGKAPKGYEAEYSRAVREGIVDPQNVFMLQGVERGKSGVGTNIWRNVAHGMGLIASATESMNRKLTLIAALDVARAKGDDWLKSKGFADAYDFAARSVAETQGVYNKGNRPAWARNPVGAVLLVFKQYSINWLEMAGRMASNHYGDDRYRKGFWMLVGALFMMAGGMGLPGVGDMIDMIETSMSWSGKPVNVERQMQMALGKDLYEPLMNGPVNSMLFNAAGADMFGRMSMGNMIPATAVANPGLTWAARSDEAVQALGAGAGLASKFVDAYNQAASGNVGQALITASPRAVTSIAKAAEMTATGQYKDSKGRTVRSVTPAEALIKGLDLQPASVARIQRERGRRFKDEAIQAQARTEIRNTLIDAYESGDQDAIDAANNRLRTWNDENPLYPVHINRRALRKTVRERGKNWSARDEAAKGMEWMNDWIPESSK